MTAEPEIAPADPQFTVLDASHQNGSGTPAQGEDSKADSDKEHRSNGKIARLPKVLRDLVNTMLDDGATYKAIIQKLNESTDPPLPYPILEINISRWKDNGYQRYLRQQAWRDDLRFLRESASEVTEFKDGDRFQETLVQLGLTEIFRSLRDGQMKTDPINHIRLFNALARLNREALGLRKYNDLLAKEEAAHLPHSDEQPSPEKAREILFTSFEQALGFPGAPAPIGPDLNEIQSRSSRGNEALTSPTPASALAAPKRSEGGSASSSASASPPPAAPNPAPEGETPPNGSAQPATCNVQPATPPSELCYSCGVPLPRLKPDGTRPSPACPGCQIRLYPPGTTFDRCQVCDAFVPILPTGERASDHCLACSQKQPPQGYRYVTECSACGSEIRNFNADGQPISDRCRHCHTSLPLLELSSPPLAALERSEGGSQTLSSSVLQAPNPASAEECGLAAPKRSEGGSPPESTAPPALAA
jgi:hypothetical protein